MKPSDVFLRFETSAGPDDATRETVYTWLREHNLAVNPGFAAAMEGGAERSLAVLARTNAGRVVGGLFGSTLLSWLRVQIVAVAPDSRQIGVGTQLMRHAEREARARYCTRAYVETMSYQSPEFYRALGYFEVGQIADWDSHGHAKFFLTKQL